MTVITVRSDSDPDTGYEVDAEAGVCSCPHYSKKLKDLNAQDGGQRVCKHIIRARQGETHESPAAG